MAQPQLLKPDHNKRKQAHQFLHNFASVILSTTDNQGQPHSSYAPHIISDACFYVYVSQLAKHAQTLINGRASLLFVEDEKQAKNVFARTRLTIKSKVLVIDPSLEDHSHLLDVFQTRHGQTIKLLRELPDFILYQLVPQEIQFVTGFGAAYDLTPFMKDLMVS